MRKAIWLFIFISIYSAGVAQKKTAEYKQPWFSGLRVGIDLARPITNPIGLNKRVTFSGMEGTADLAIKKYYLTADFGMIRTARVDSNGTYNTSGSFFRVGPDINILNANKKQNTFFIGLRYAISSFSDESEYLFVSPVWGNTSGSISRTGNTARWFEAVTGVKINIWNNFFLGYTFRYKFGVKVNESAEFEAYDIPGFGIRSKAGRAGLNYYIFYRIPFSK
jgi:hypothetical protein